MTSTKNKTEKVGVSDVIKQTINVLTVLLYSSRLCSNNKKESILNLSERQYRVITIGDNKSNDKNNTKERKKKKKTFAHLIRFFMNKMEIICLLNMLIEVFKNSKEGLISTFLLSMWAIIFFSNFFYFAEIYDCHYDEKTETYYRFNKFNERENCRVQSILDAYWWAVVTIQCIGYGDLTPATSFGKIVNGFLVFIANVIFMIPSAILTIEFLDILMKTKKDDVIEKAIKKCESKIDKARKKKFHKELMSILSLENMQNNANTFIKYYSINENTFIKYYSINESLSGSTISMSSHGSNDSPVNVIDFFKLKKSNNSLGRPLDITYRSNNSIGRPLDKNYKNNNSISYQLDRKCGSIDSVSQVKSVSYHESVKSGKGNNTFTEYIKPVKSNSANENNSRNDKILKSSELVLSDPTTTIKYGLGDKLFSKKSNNPDLLKLNKIIKHQQYLNRITTQSDSNRRPVHTEGSGDSYSSVESTGRNRKNAKGEIAVELTMGEVKYMNVREISKELYKLSMEYYAQCDDEFSDVDEQSVRL
ncbi:hypothetical protein PIROE2DRAFT_11146 [Piromyces sp. E2]|nr:hypothetical protein PIROE2DRAFT_11146 [Piromyces sp. E2]|eukprot:OUM62562.1 hypothetical protein PIROE2DRAFT_11146 [Piromyces sp. E2]